MENPYKTLGVQQDATIEQITMAYRRLSAKHHPDRNGGDTTKMQEINQAYALLSDVVKRAEWDEVGGSSAIRMAREMLQNELKVLLNLNRDGDLIKMLGESCESRRRQVMVGHSHARSAIKNLNRKLASLKGPESGNFLKMVFEGQIKTHEFGLRECEEALEIIATAESLLKGFSYAQETQPDLSGLVGTFQGRPGSIQWWQKD